MVRVLILQNKLLHYRIPVFNLLNDRSGLDVTVAHPGKPAKESEITFKQIILMVFHVGPFVLHKNLFSLCCKYDVVFAMFDLKWLTHMKLALKSPRPFRLIFWGIGVSTAKGFDADNRFDIPRFFFAKRADGLLLYSEKAKQKYLSANIKEKQLFVASNTVENSTHVINSSTRDCFIFLGSLNRRKGLDELVEAFRIVSEKASCNLVIIGDGSERENLTNLIDRYSLQERVELKGQINSLKRMEVLFNRAIACISPGQAGLSVLRSFSLGVPFICRSDAITGGERFDIENDYNGYQYTGGAECLARIMFKLVMNPEKARLLGENALDFYLSSRTLNHMVDGFEEAINSNK